VKLLYHATGGMVSGLMFGERTLVLSRALNDEPCTVLLPYFEYDGARVVVAMQADTDAEDDWWYQLRNGAVATVSVDGATIAGVRGRELSGADRARAWAAIVQKAPVYAEMESAALKPFPLVALTTVP
jgi:hypothetical protein